MPCETWILLLLYNYVDLLFISILRYFSRSSEVLLNSQVCIIFIYIQLPTFNSDEIVMSREHSKIFTYTFCKSGALHMCSLWLVSAEVFGYFFEYWWASGRFLWPSGWSQWKPSCWAVSTSESSLTPKNCLSWYLWH